MIISKIELSMLLDNNYTKFAYFNDVKYETIYLKLKIFVDNKQELKEFSENYFNDYHNCYYNKNNNFFEISYKIFEDNNEECNTNENNIMESLKELLDNFDNKTYLIMVSNSDWDLKQFICDILLKCSDDNIEIVLDNSFIEYCSKNVSNCYLMYTKWKVRVR